MMLIVSLVFGATLLNNLRFPSHSNDPDSQKAHINDLPSVARKLQKMVMSSADDGQVLSVYLM